MPSNEKMQYANDINEDMLKEIEKHIMSDIQPKDSKDIWKPESYEYKKELSEARGKFQNDIFNDWSQIKEQGPAEKFRKQTTKDIAEIKDAIRKIGIMFGEDAPSKEMMEKHKMLKDAYNKYKMIEALILGQDK